MRPTRAQDHKVLKKLIISKANMFSDRAIKAKTKKQMFALSSIAHELYLLEITIDAYYKSF